MKFAGGLEGYVMDTFTEKELAEAMCAITSTMHKSEKVQLKLQENTFQHTINARGIKAYNIAIKLIEKELGMNTATGPDNTKEELNEALQMLTSVIGRVENVLPKFNPGTSQHTLAIRRIKAFTLAAELIKKEMFKIK